MLNGANKTPALGSVLSQCRCRFNVDTARFYGFWNITHQGHMEQSIVQLSCCDLDMFGQVEAPLKSPGRNSTMQLGAAVGVALVV